MWLGCEDPQVTNLVLFGPLYKFTGHTESGRRLAGFFGDAEAVELLGNFEVGLRENLHLVLFGERFGQFLEILG